MAKDNRPEAIQEYPVHRREVRQMRQRKETIV